MTVENKRLSQLGDSLEKSTPSHRQAKRRREG